jgi:NTE family protein
VGGAYANGMSIESMDQLFGDMNLTEILTGEAERKNRPFQKKQADFTNYIGITLGVRDREIVAAASAVRTHYLEMFLKNLAGPSFYDSFDQMPIPFRAVATNLETGDAHVFSQGDLATAMRSSSAVPGVFAPLEYEGRLLVDGGLSRQLPILEAKACADHLIVIDVSSPMYRKDDIRSFVDVLAQTTNLTIAKNVKESLALLKPDDVYIVPDLGDFSASKFGEYATVRKLAAQDIQRFERVLSKYSIDAESYQTWRQGIQRPEPTVIQHLVVNDEALRFVNAEQLAIELTQTQTTKSSINSHEPYTEMALQNRLNDAFTTGDYDNLHYTLAKNDQDEVVANIYPVERSIGPNYLKFGLDFNASSALDSDYSLRLSHERVWFNDWNATWTNELAVGDQLVFQSKFIQPFGPKSNYYSSLALDLLRGTNGLPTLSGEVAWADIEHQSHALTASLGYQHDVYGDIGLTISQGKDKQHTEPDFLSDSSRASITAIGAFLNIDQLDSARWPRNGYALSLYGARQSYADATGYYLDADSFLFNGRLDIAHTFSNEVTIRGTTSYEHNANGLIPFGGFLKGSGFQQDELSAEELLFIRTMAYWRTTALPEIVGSGVYIGLSLEAAAIKHQAILDDLSPDLNELKVTRINREHFMGGSLFLGADTIIGPAFLGLGYSNEANLMGYIYLGTDF